jgi:hypothetical protein
MNFQFSKGHPYFQFLNCVLALLLASTLPTVCSQNNGAMPVQTDNSIYASALTFQVNAREEMCFFEDMEANMPLNMEFEVIRGGLLDIHLKISDPSDTIIFEKMAFFNRPDETMNVAEGRISVSTKDAGAYKICFDNTMSKFTAKVVSFYVVSSVKPHSSHADAATLAHLGPIVDSVIAISDKLDVVESMQYQMRIREKVGHDTLDVNYSRGTLLFIIETIVLIVLSVLKSSTIMQWFSNRQNVGRV